MTTVAELMDISAAAWSKGARHGDIDAARTMHAIFADYLKHCDLPPMMRDLLVHMHQQIADGVDAAAATLTAPPASRRITHTKQERIANEVLASIVLWNVGNQFRDALTARGHHIPAKLNMSAIYQDVAANFGVSQDYVKKIWLAKKR